MINRLAALLTLIFLWPAVITAQAADVPGKKKNTRKAVVYSGIPGKWKKGSQKAKSAQDKDISAANQRYVEAKSSGTPGSSGKRTPS